MELGGPIHEIALVVLQKPEEERLEAEILVLMKWLRELSNKDAKQGKVTVLGEIQDEVLYQIVKGCKLESFVPNQILIKQGNVGFKMYIILTGSCDIRIGAADIDDEDDNADDQNKCNEGDIMKKKADLEQFLGVSVGTFKAGHAFGEVALVSGVLRTASVIVNPESEICQVLVIDKDLFDRTLQEYMQKEEELRTSFIQQFHYFESWTPKFKMQLQRGLTKARFKFDEVVVRQGDEIEFVYFIIEGEVKLSMIPELHRQQYSRSLGDHADLVFGGEKRPLNEKLTNVRKSITWCCLGKNEIMEELVLLTGLKSCMCTAVATMETHMFRLNIKEWERIVVRRMPQTFLALKEDTLCRLSRRTLLEDTTEVPMLGYAFSTLYEDVRKKEKVYFKKVKKSAADITLPKIGLLIDIQGKGTVFDYINRRFRHQQKRRLATATSSSRQGHTGRRGVSKQERRSVVAYEPPISAEIMEYYERCKLLKILVEGVTESRFTIGTPFLAKVELEKIGLKHLERLVTKFCSDLKLPGEKKVTIPHLSCPQLPSPPKDAQIGILRPVQKILVSKSVAESRKRVADDSCLYLPQLGVERKLATRQSYH